MLATFRRHRATLIAISPQRPALNQEMITAHKLEFDILSDPGNTYAASLGLRFELPEALREIYRGFGIDLAVANGEPSWTLPMPGRIVVDRDGVVRATDVDPDYTVRPEPEDTLQEILKLGA